MQRGKELSQGRRCYFRRRGLELLLAFAILWTAATKATCQNDGLAAPATQWAAEAASNEMKVLNYEHSYLRYRMHIVNAKGNVVRDVIESKDGPVARLIMKEGRPLTAEENDAEHRRLQAMLDSPAAFAKHVNNDERGKKMAAEFIRLLPDAMEFAYAPGQPQRAVRGDDTSEIVIDFQPNPAWNPPSMTSEALLGIEGRAWIDPRTHFMTELQCRVFRGVNLGWGIFAHIYPGGTASFQQVRITDQRWIFSRFVEHATVRALMVKTFKEDSDIQGSNFSPVTSMSYQDAIRLLLATPLPAQ